MKPFEPSFSCGVFAFFLLSFFLSFVALPPVSLDERQREVMGAELVVGESCVRATAFFFLCDVEVEERLAKGRVGVGFQDVFGMPFGQVGNMFERLYQQLLEGVSCDVVGQSPLGFVFGKAGKRVFVQDLFGMRELRFAEVFGKASADGARRAFGHACVHGGGLGLEPEQLNCVVVFVGAENSVRQSGIGWGYVSSYAQHDGDVGGYFVFCREVGDALDFVSGLVFFGCVSEQG